MRAGVTNVVFEVQIENCKILLCIRVTALFLVTLGIIITVLSCTRYGISFWPYLVTIDDLVGLGPGSSSQYSICTGCDICHCTGPDQCTGGRGCAATPAPPQLARGPRRRRPRSAPLEAPCRRHFFTRFGFTRTKKYVVLGPCFKCDMVVD